MSVLQMSVSGGVLIAVVLLLRTLTAKKLPKITFKIMWYIALARLLIPFDIPCAVSVYSIFSRSPEETATANTTAPAPRSDYTWDFLTYSGENEAPTITHSEAAPKVDAWKMIRLSGTGILATFFVISYLKNLAKFRESLPVDDDFTRDWLNSHKVRRRISVRYSDRVSSPLTYGIFRPVILLPKNADGSVLKYALAHEFVHIRQFDAVFKLLIAATVCVHWFNPLVWAMCFFANRDIEISCDETVLRTMGFEKTDYALALIRSEEHKSGLVLGSGFAGNTVKERIMMIMKYKKVTAISVAAAVALTAGTVTVFATSPSDDKSSAANEVNSIMESLSASSQSTEQVGENTDETDAVENDGATAKIESDSDNPNGSVKGNPDTETVPEEAKEDEMISVMPVLPVTNAPADLNYSSPKDFQKNEYGGRGIVIYTETHENVYSVGGGKVLLADYDVPLGNIVIIGYDNGNYGSYFYLDSMEVKKGDTVEAGQLIGYSGTTGKTDAACLGYLCEKEVSQNLLARHSETLL